MRRNPPARRSTSSETATPSLRTTLHHALALDSQFYDEAHYPYHRRLALIIVLLAAGSHALGSLVILLINRVSWVSLVSGLVINGLSVVVGYYGWTWAIWKIGQWLKPIDPTYGDLLSPIGFAYAPQVLNFLTLIPLLGQLIALILAVWSLLAVIVAVRAGLDITTRSAIGISLLSWIPLQVAIGTLQVFVQ